MRSRGDESRLSRDRAAANVFPAPFQAGQLCSVEGITETARTQGGGFSGITSVITHAPAAAMAGICASRPHRSSDATQMSQMITMDASAHGWGVVCEGMPASGL